jgi:hypothetical protein
MLKGLVSLSMPMIESSVIMSIEFVVVQGWLD